MQSEKDKARVAALPDSQAAATKIARKAPPTNSKKGESAKDDADGPCPQNSKNKQATSKKKVRFIGNPVGAMQATISGQSQFWTQCELR